MPISDIKFSYLLPYELAVQNVIVVMTGEQITKENDYDLHGNGLALHLHHTISITMKLSFEHLFESV